MFFESPDPDLHSDRYGQRSCQLQVVSTLGFSIENLSIWQAMPLYKNPSFLRKTRQKFLIISCFSCQNSSITSGKPIPYVTHPLKIKFQRPEVQNIVKIHIFSSKSMKNHGFCLISASELTQRSRHAYRNRASTTHFLTLGSSKSPEVIIIKF